MSPPTFEGAIFDLDGVVTRTALAHSRAWKQMFDEYLRVREARDGEPFREFTHEHDYLEHVDGRPRYAGVRAFLASRGISVPSGDPADPPAAETICGLGNRKNELVNQLFEEGVEVFPSTVRLIEELRLAGVKVGVASSSENCRAILAVAGITHLFDTRVDGTALAELGLAGKPEPDMFTTACERLGVRPEQSVVVEDARSGVQAGAMGNFGLVLGVARADNHAELCAKGADFAVSDLEEVDLERIEEWFRTGLGDSTWTLRYDGLLEGAEPHREALCTVGNGYFGTRGAFEECAADGSSYPATYVAGVYNRLASTIAGRTVENEDLVNCPSWLPITFRVGDGEWVNPKALTVLSCQRRLDLRRGTLGRKLVVRDLAGRETEVLSERLASMAEPHVGALRYRVVPLNYSGTLRFRSRLDGDVANVGVERYRQLASRHLEPLRSSGAGPESFLSVRTSRSQIEVALASRLSTRLNGRPVSKSFEVREETARVTTELDVRVEQGDTVTVDKLVTLYTSRDREAEPLAACRSLLSRLESYDVVVSESARRWEELWDLIDVRLRGDRRTQMLLRLHLYHLLCTASPHSVALDASIPARGLHGEAYRGHIFWDISFILPLYSMHLPEVARSVLTYRYARLDEARRAAREAGCKGAMFPWQSGSEGREETQVVHLNPLSGEWGADHSALQRHVSLAIAWDVWTHYAIAGDLELLERCGAELFLEICRFWASLAQLDPETGRYEIRGVMGPDEYHEMLPGASQAGLKDNGYTNLMAAWALARAHDVLEALGEEAREGVLAKVGLDEVELERFRAIQQGLGLVVEEGVVGQFDGYFALQELDWDRYRRQHGNIHRMDRILKAEGLSPDSFKVAKQADALMVFYSLSPEEVDRLVRDLGYGEALGEGYLEKSFHYYLQRTSHGSTLSKVVHGHLAVLLGLSELGSTLYGEALESDFVDVQGGTTGEGIHTGVMGGTVLGMMRSFAGLDLGTDPLSIDPRLPERWREVSFGFGFKGDRYRIEVTQDALRLLIEEPAEPAEVVVRGERVRLVPGKWQRAEL